MGGREHLGELVVEMDLRPALSMLDDGYGLKAISKSLGVSRATLRRRLVEAGEWPRQEVEKAVPGEALSGG